VTVLLGMCAAQVLARRRRSVRPFVILGMNAIAIYIVSKLLDSGLRILHWRRPIYETMFAPLFSPINASLSYAVTYTLLMFVIAWVMCTRAVFLKRKRQEYDMASCGRRSRARCRPPSSGRLRSAVWPLGVSPSI
jgi:predicted acyltransferase